jgi:ubiquinone/menaquinone biosynthesis C-methylase UbiE
VQIDAEEAERKHAEAEFHNKRERDRAVLTDDEFEARYSNKKFYSVVRGSTDFLARWIADHAPSGLTLDYCCGLGGVSLQVAQEGGHVVGFDISDESVETARRTMREHGLGARGQFMVMDAERLGFPDKTFDVIVVSGVLHHLDVDRAYPELARVLQPGGRILCMEALGYNPIINLYRRRTPHLRTAWEAKHILTLKEVKKARAYFGRVSVRYFHLSTIGAVLFRRTPVFSPVLSVLEAIDSVILRIPFLQRMAWQMFFELSEPRST